MLIVIEGPDSVGKTTLAKLLAEKYGLDYLHFGIPDEHPMDYWFKTLVKVTRPTVIDRLHISEEVYGPVYRGGSQLSPHDYWMIEGWLWARDGAMILCTVPKTVMFENQARNKGEYHNEKQSLIYDTFGQKAPDTSLDVLVFDYTRGYAPPQACADLPLAIDWSDHGMGTVVPEVWLVGEKHGPEGKAGIRAFTPQTCFQGGSGEYLRKTLQLIEWSWRTFHLSNALNRDSSEIDLAAKWQRLGYPKTVALGKTADSQLTKAKIPHTHVPHPQYWRRFKNKDMEGYGHAIYSASRD